MLKTGDVAPDFKVRNHRGEEVRLSDFRGRQVVLWFFPKADTPGCTAEGCGFRDRIAHFEKSKAVVLGVSFDSVEDNRRFAEKHDFPFDLLSDLDQAIAKAYGAFDPDQPTRAKRIAFTIGATGRITRAWDKVRPDVFPGEVVAGLGHSDLGTIS